MYKYIKSKNCNIELPILEITISDTDEYLLKETNLFNKNDIISFCVFASYGNIEICYVKNEKDITGNFEDVKYIKIIKEGDIN